MKHNGSNQKMRTINPEMKRQALLGDEMTRSGDLVFKCRREGTVTSALCKECFAGQECEESNDYPTIRSCANANKIDSSTRVELRSSMGSYHAPSSRRGG